MDYKYSRVVAGILFGLFTLIYSEILAAGFGFYESDIKHYLKTTAYSHVAHDGPTDPDSFYFKSKSEASSTASKAWVYFKRAHMHGEGLGVIAITASILLANSIIAPWCQLTLSLAVGLGAFLYPLSWFFAGLFMVSEGKHAAREKLYYAAVGGSGIYLAGLCMILLLLLLSFCRNKIRFLKIFYL